MKARLREVGADVIGARTFTTPKASRLTIPDFLEALKADFQLRGKDSRQNLSHLKRAEDDFGSSLAVALTSEKIDAYKKERLANGDRPASINRLLQLIRQAYGLAVKRDHLSRMPCMEFLSEKGNARKVFCEESEFRTIHGLLRDYLQDLALFGYCTGMRLGEVLSLKRGVREGRRDRTAGRGCQRRRRRRQRAIDSYGWQRSRRYTRTAQNRAPGKNERYHDTVRAGLPSQRQPHCGHSQGLENRLQKGGRSRPSFP